MIVPSFYRKSVTHRRLWATMKFLVDHDIIGPVVESVTKDAVPIIRSVRRDAIDRRKAVLEHEAGDRLETYFDEERTRVGKALVAGRKVAPVINALEPELTKIYDAMIHSTAEHWGSWAKRHMPISKADYEYRDDVDIWLAENVGKKITGITESSRKNVAAEIAAGVEAGESGALIAKRIDKFYLENVIPNRSVVIARTEVGGITNWLQNRIAVNSGVPMEKEWMSLHDNRTRDTHVAADGQMQPLDEPFEVGDDMLMYPGDPSGSPEEIIQCRCTTLHHVAQGEAPPHKSASPYQFAKQVMGFDNADVITGLAFMQGVYGPEDDWEMARKSIMKRVHHLRRGELV